jgi:DNA-binding NarL/FixJ family response regulator
MKDEAEPGAQTTPRRVLIADDHELVRQGLRGMLAYEQDLEVVGEASDGREAVELCRSLDPDLVLMDVRMPEMDGLEATRLIKAEQPSISVLIITTYENQDYLVEAIKAGAAGYILKDAPNQRLLSAMRRALSGEFPINQELAVQVIKRLTDETMTPTEPTSELRDRPEPRPHLLTDRELEVLRLLAQGQTNQEIGQNLMVSTWTVKTHVQRIIGKLKVSDRTQAALHAAELGLLTSEPEQ